MRYEDTLEERQFYQEELKKRDEMLVGKEKEVSRLMQEIQRIKAASENEVKKLKKALGGNGGSS